MTDIRVLVVGLGNMGLSHARAYKAIEGFEIAGLRDRAALPKDVYPKAADTVFDQREIDFQVLLEGLDLLRSHAVVGELLDPLGIENLGIYRHHIALNLDLFAK